MKITILQKTYLLVISLLLMAVGLANAQGPPPPGGEDEGDGGGGTRSNITGSAHACSGTAYTYTATKTLSSYKWTVTSGATIQGSSTNRQVVVLFTGSGGAETVTLVSHATISVAVNSSILPGAISGSKTICYNGSGGTLNSTSGRTRGSYSQTYLWQKKVGSGNWTNIASSNSASLTVGNLTATTSYRRQAIDHFCQITANTNVVTITVRPDVQPGSISGSRTICYNDNPPSFTNSSSASGGVGTLSYQWQRQVAGSASWLNISGATSATYNPNALTSTTSYRRRVTNSTCNVTKYTNIVTITVRAPLNAGSITGQQTICYNANPTAISNSANASGGGNSYDYQWQKKTTGSWSNIGSATGTSYDPSNLTVTTDYRRRAIDRNGCGTVYTNEVRVTVRPLVVAGSISGDQSIWEDATPEVITGTSAGGGAGGYSYVWQSRPLDGSWTDITGSNVQNYNPGPLTSSMEYRRRVIDASCGNKTSNSVTILVTPGAEIRVIGPTDLRAEGETTKLESVLPYTTYSWRRNYGAVLTTSRAHTTAVPGSFTMEVTLTGVTGSYIAGPVIITKCGDLNPKDFNEIIATTIITPGVTNDSQIALLAPDEKMVSVNYFDGLGRGIQTSQLDYSPDEGHVIQLIEYDAFGRQPVQYLPYVKYDCPIVVSNAKSEQADFYLTEENIDNDAAPFITSILESSPLNRVFKQGAEGTVWQPNASLSVTNDKVLRMSYETNEADEVRLWEVNGGLLANSSTTPFYIENQLFKNVSTDEHGNLVITFTDKLGQTILKKVQANDAGEAEEWADTYYVYDHLNNLRFVLPPEASSDISTYLSSSSSQKQAFLDQWAFQYNYDDRQRMVEKRVPGSDWVYLIYDNRDRLVLTQDGNQRDNQVTSGREWTFTKYDAQHRPILTGTYVHGSVLSRSNMQNYVNARAGSTMAWFETLTGNVHGYTNNAFPSVSNEDEYLTVVYYDNYGFRSLSDFGSKYAYSAQELSGELPSSEHLAVKGQVTGGKTRVLGGAQWINAVSYYDHRYRSIQVVTDNHGGGTDRVSNVYNFPGWVMKTKTSHNLPEKPLMEVVRRFDYDHTGRILRGYHRLYRNGVDQGEVLLAENQYNELGQLIEKNLHVEGGTPVQSVDFRYNIRGWLETINSGTLDIIPGINESDATPDYFGMELFYNKAVIGVTID